MLQMFGQKMTFASGWDRQRVVSNHPNDPISKLKSVGETSQSDLAVEQRLHFAKAGRSTRDMKFEMVIATMRQAATQSASYHARSEREQEIVKAGRRAAADSNIDRMERQLSRSRSGFQERRIQQTLPGEYNY